MDLLSAEHGSRGDVNLEKQMDWVNYNFVKFICQSPQLIPRFTKDHLQYWTSSQLWREVAGFAPIICGGPTPVYKQQ